jgi:hypothetical protein
MLLDMEHHHNLIIQSSLNSFNRDLHCKCYINENILFPHGFVGGVGLINIMIEFLVIIASLVVEIRYVDQYMTFTHYSKMVGSMEVLWQLINTIQHVEGPWICM